MLDGYLRPRLYLFRCYECIVHIAMIYPKKFRNKNVLFTKNEVSIITYKIYGWEGGRGTGGDGWKVINTYNLLMYEYK